MAEASERRRRTERAEVSIGANCRTDNGRRAFVAMIDLTTAGCCLFGRENPLAVGQKVTLHPECLAPIRGIVQWSRGSLAGLLFESELYPAVFEHLARTHPWGLSESAKLALDRRVDVPATVQRELTRMIGRAEDMFRKRETTTDVLTTRTLVMGSRPGIASQETDGKLLRLFLA